MVHFVGAGSGAPDLITLRGKTLLEQADVIIYAGSLVNPQLNDYAKEGCQIYPGRDLRSGGERDHDGASSHGRSLSVRSHP